MAKPTPAKPTEARAGRLKSRLLDAGRVASHMAAWAGRNPLQAAIISGIVLLPVLPIVVVQWSLSRHLPKQPLVSDVEAALAALDKGDFSRAAEIAHSFGAEGPMTADELRVKPFLLGVAADHDAERLLGPQQRRLRAVAARYLSEARILGFFDGREAEGLFLLGKDLYESGQTAESVSVLEEALKSNPERLELHRLLAGAYLDQAEPQYHQALAHNTRYLADEHLPSAQRQQALFQRSRIEFALGDYAACLKSLTEIPDESSLHQQVVVMRALLLEQEAEALDEQHAAEGNRLADEKRRSAIQLLEPPPGHRRSPDASAPDVAYLIGRLRLALGEDEAGLSQLQHTAQRWPDTEAGFAAGIAAAQRLGSLGRLSEAVGAYRDAMKALDPETQFKNRWLSLDEVRTSTLDAYQELLLRQQFELAISLAVDCRPVLGATRSLQLEAQAHAQWGRHLLMVSEGGDTPDQAKQLSTGRRRLRQAGILYRRLAEMRLASREYADDLYDAAEAELAGHDYAAAVTTFRKYLDVEARKRRPRALLALGESLLAAGQPAAALEPLKECIEFHQRDAAIFEARFLASQAYLETAQTGPAEKLLLDNLDGAALSPASTEWRSSLFALGRLLYEAGRYKEAIGRLDEATARYPTAAGADEANYLAAESYRRSALKVQRQEQQEATAEGRLARRREWTQLLEIGLARYEKELSAMLVRQEQRPLTRLEQAVLRNCFFARADILFDLGRYQEAIQAYASATNRYQQRPEVLPAYVQIAACYRRLGQADNARSTLEQAKYALKHLGEDLPFEQTSNYTRQEWGQLF
ncbi:MAG TPA: tetratricopeptide repeat protein, partial [Pirellulales bacterium]|nr:tetratricopeptide repeat protein [Pirellulales bacterium]